MCEKWRGRGKAGGRSPRHDTRHMVGAYYLRVACVHLAQNESHQWNIRDWKHMQIMWGTRSPPEAWPGLFWSLHLKGQVSKGWAHIPQRELTLPLQPHLLPEPPCITERLETNWQKPGGKELKWFRRMEGLAYGARLKKLNMYSLPKWQLNRAFDKSINTWEMSLPRRRGNYLAWHNGVLA